MTREEYGEKYQEHLLEQYILYVEMADNVSERRDRSNAFYFTVLSGLFILVSAVIAFFGAEDVLTSTMIGAIGLVGFSLCIIWFFNIRSYKQLNSGKFKVVHKMESLLPFACYDEEWTILEKGKNKKVYWPFTHVEKWVPVIMALPYFFLIICCIIKLATF